MPRHHRIHRPQTLHLIIDAYGILHEYATAATAPADYTTFLVCTHYLENVSGVTFSYNLINGSGTPRKQYTKTNADLHISCSVCCTVHVSSETRRHVLSASTSILHSTFYSYHVIVRDTLRDTYLSNSGAASTVRVTTHCPPRATFPRLHVFLESGSKYIQA